MAKEVSPRWRLGDNQRVYSSGNKIVARLLTGAGKKQIVKYADSDTTNLRRSHFSRSVRYGNRENNENKSWAMASASRAFGNSWQIQPSTILSTARNATRLELPRRSTMICCRNTRISASSAARGLNRSATAPRIILQRANIPWRIIRFHVPSQSDGIHDRDKIIYYPTPLHMTCVTAIACQKGQLITKSAMPKTPNVIAIMT
jgi:hypothetical protein